MLLMVSRPTAKAVEKNPVTADKGALVIHSKLLQEGRVALAGEWEFYWNQLLSPDDFKQTQSANLTGFIKVPAIWNDLSVGSEKLMSKGFATYRLTVLIKENRELLTITIPEIPSAYKLWVNGEKVLDHQKVAIDASQSIGGPGSRSVMLSPPPQRLELILQVSNYFHRDGGIWLPPILNLSISHLLVREKAIIVDGLVIGAILIIAFYHLMLLMYQRNRVENLYFFGFCLFLAVRTLVVGDGELLYSLVPADVSWELARKLEYLGYYSPIVFLTFFLRAMFPQEIQTWFIRFAAWPNIVQIVIVLLFSAQFYSEIISYAHLFTLLIIFLGMISIVKASLAKREGAAIFLLGFLVLSLTTINDILVSKHLLPFGYFSQYGLLLFIFIQSAIISIRFSKAFTSLEKAESRLQESNANLDLMVVDRTKKLESTNSKLLGEIERHTQTIQEKEQIQKQVVHASKLSLLGQMAAGVGHEINNPLAISMGNLQLLQAESAAVCDEHPKFSKRLEKINHANDRIRKIVDGLRVLARKDTQHQEIVSLCEKVKLTVDMVMDIYQDEGVQVDFKSPKDDISVLGSPGRIEQMIMNLISNAKDATNGLGRRIIEISLNQSSKDEAVLTVRDSGTGIPQDIKEKILEPFFTTKPSGEGTGMGLSFVDKTVADLKGTISFDSALEAGTTFRVVLPRHQSKEAGCEPITVEKTATEEKLDLDILIVDDEEDILDILSEILELAGCSVDTTSDGNIAVEQVKAKRYDFLLTDLKMPIMDGITLLKRVHELNLPSQPILIVITGGVDADFEEQSNSTLSSIIDGHLFKPFDNDSVISMLRKKLVERESNYSE
jgi:signal transduction histidine kinase/CheY-like chemotaxis protein